MLVSTLVTTCDPLDEDVLPPEVTWPGELIVVEAAPAVLVAVSVPADAPVKLSGTRIVDVLDVELLPLDAL